VPGCKPHCDMGVAVVTVSRKQSKDRGASVDDGSDRHGRRRGGLSMAWLELMGERADSYLQR
jgi:hypothetical protein